jgi:hypothetical protein
MNRLQKRAWVELAGAVGLLIIGGASVGVMVYGNTKGIGYMIIFLVAGGTAGLLSCVHELRVFNKYDEREKKICLQALILSDEIFIGFIVCCAVITLFSIGGKGSIPAWSIMAMLLAGLFIRQLVQSAAILIRCAMEENDG